MLVESHEKLTGNARFEGFAIDLATELSALLGFNFTFKLVDDGKVLFSFLQNNIARVIFVSTVAKHLPVTGMECWER